MNKLSLPIVVLSLIFLILTNVSVAATVTIDANGVKTRIYAGGAGWVDTGATKDFELANNSEHYITIGWAGNGVNRFLINIDENGVVSSDTTRATIVNNKITLKTSLITIDPEKFKGRYHFFRYLSGIQTIAVVPAGTGSMDEGSRYSIGNGTGGFRIEIEVTADGNISSDSTRLMLDGSKLTFITTPIEVEAGLFKGIYGIGKSSRGNSTIHLIKGGTGEMDIGNKWSLGNGSWPWITYVYVDENGHLSSDSTRITVLNNQMTLLTTPIEVNPNLYLGQYMITGNHFGAQTIHLIRAGTGEDDFGNVWNLSNGTWPFRTKLHLDHEGNVTSDSTRVNAEGNNISLNTIPITITPGDYLGNYTLAGKQWSGAQTLNLMPAGHGTDDSGSSYRININGLGSTTINIESPCAILPAENVVIGEGEEAISLNISCDTPILDSDEDGVADSADNCPLMANSDQLDQDDDGLGNICDLDLDGDSIDNNIDNCPDFSNIDQSDLDDDLIGDPCDDDIDGDTIPDAVDNCSLITNINQADNDSDGAGDVCDVDDDNDSFVDLEDNCPNHSNYDQLDSDYDGAGDICDSDIDGDGIGNDLDLCLLTPINTAITQDGCNAEQHIVKECSIENSPNHGKYVSCVAKEAKSLVDLGLISQKEKSRYVTQAARNK
ncbi:hypothetical protein A9Q98_13050 [Thalassotalea sp. 42_200_T64]|nr:hypothetical protein A9Q98_13050 [Thalassotalea sp. 42_200_T64]